MELPLPRILFSVVLFFGIVFTFLIPPMQTPDEDAHFLRAYSISQGQIMPRKNGDDCGNLPTALVRDLERFYTIKGHVNEKYTYLKWRSDTYETEDLKPQTRYCHTAQTASPLLYIPPVVGMLVGRVIYWASPTTQTYNWMGANRFAHLGNVLAWALAASLACAWASRFGAIIFALSTLPMVMQAAASTSYDVTTLSACVLFFALVVKIAARQERPTRWETVGLIGLGFLVAHAKLVYVPEVALVWVLRRWMPWRAFLYLCGGLALAVLVGIITGAGQQYATAHEIQLQHQQLSQILPHPGRLLMRMLYTIGEQRDFYTVSFLGDFGWLDTPAPLPLLMLVGATLACAVVGDALRGPSPLGWIGSGLLLAVAAASFVAVHLALYVIWSAKAEGVGSTLISGVQGRYLLPVALLAMAGIAAGPAMLARRTGGLRINLLHAQVVTTLATLTVCGLVLFTRFWLPDTATAVLGH